MNSFMCINCLADLKRFILEGGSEGKGGPEVRQGSFMIEGTIVCNAHAFEMINVIEMPNDVSELEPTADSE